MRKLVVSLLFLLYCAPMSARAQAYSAQPKLVVLLVIDQFRGDYLDRYRDALTTQNGFNLFLKKGAYFGSCYYDYANTKTAPGHATIGTGAYTDGHGIGSNEWWDLSRNADRVVSSVEDERYRIVGNFDDLPVGRPGTIPPAAPRIGASPLNLRATTFGDEVRLATGGQARLFGISLKDRASILPSGQTANAAYWIDQASGRFITSTYYMAQLPQWVAAFNTGPRTAQAIREANLPPETTQFYNLVGRTPAANRYELDFARELIAREKLGQGRVTDVLTVSLSANDILGHQFGPNSDAQREMVLALDRDLDAFFTWLDQTIGLPNVIVAFTADHGVAPIPAEAAKLGVAAARIDLEALATNLDAALNQRFSPAAKKHYLMPGLELPYLQLDPRAFAAGPSTGAAHRTVSRGVSGARAGKAGTSHPIGEAEAEQAVVEAIPAAMRALGAPIGPPRTAALPEATRKFEESRVNPDPQIAFVRSRVDLAEGKIPATEFGRLIAHSYTANGGWYVMLVPTAYQMELLKGIQTTHFSPWSYDRHVPLGFYGTAFVPGYYRDPVAPVDLAATLASLLGVNAPSSSVGHVLTQALRTASSR